jgi:Mor family transcriptional regulator
MATSVYFDKGQNTEQNLYEDLIVEQLKLFGHDVYYLPRTLVKEDTLFGEDVLSKFDDSNNVSSLTKVLGR